MRVCPQCQSDRLVNNGSAAGKPKKQCQQCGYQFTRTTPRGKPLTTKINAVLLYLSGISMNRIAFLLHVSAQAVLNWIRTFAQKFQEKPEPTGRSIILGWSISRWPCLPGSGSMVTRMNSYHYLVETLRWGMRPARLGQMEGHARNAHDRTHPGSLSRGFCYSLSWQGPGPRLPSL
jgi:transposase-like protein